MPTLPFKALNIHQIYIVPIYLIRNRIKRLFKQALKPNPVVDDVGREVTGIERVHE